MCIYESNSIIYVNNVDKQLTHAMHVQGRYANDTLIGKLTKLQQDSDWIFLYRSLII